MGVNSLVVTAICDDGGFVDEEHFDIIVECAKDDDLFLTETNRRLRGCARPATAVLGQAAEA